MSHVITKDDKMTIYKRGGRLSQNQYDTFWYQANYTGENIIVDSSRVVQAWNLDFESGPTDLPPASITEEENKKVWLYGKNVFDHLPVVIYLRIDQDSDNFN